MDILDAQVHLFLGLQEDAALGAMDALGVQAILIDEVWGFAPDRDPLPTSPQANGVRRPISPLAQAAALRHPDRFSFVQRIKRGDPLAEALVEVLGSSAGCRAVRIDLRPTVEREAMASGSYDVLLRLARKYGLAVSVLARQISDSIRDVARRFPDNRFILDHCGSPRSDSDWADVLSLGVFENVWLKWSHAHNAFEAGSYPYLGLQAQLARAIEAFGVERVMWASDYTHHHHGATWSQLLHYVRDSTTFSIADKEWILARAARSALAWPAPSEPARPAHAALVPPPLEKLPR